jgi:hypothetical protein
MPQRLQLPVEELIPYYNTFLGKVKGAHHHPPQELPWGISAVFEDLYGHQHNLLEPR